MSSKIVITAGHSNVDPGAVAGKDTEAELVTKYRNALVASLKDLGLIAITDGAGTVNLPLNTAIQLAKEAVKSKGIALEIHMNAAVSTQANGVETIAMPKDKALAQQISAASANALGFRLRGDKGWIDQSQSHRGKLGYISAGGMILELAFISNPGELAAFKANYWKSARAVAQVIASHMKGK